jgi:hypothetical protein
MVGIEQEPDFRPFGGGRSLDRVVLDEVAHRGHGAVDRFVELPVDSEGGGDTHGANRHPSGRIARYDSRWDRRRRFIEGERQSGCLSRRAAGTCTVALLGLTHAGNKEHEYDPQRDTGHAVSLNTPHPPSMLPCHGRGPMIGGGCAGVKRDFS